MNTSETNNPLNEQDIPEVIINDTAPIAPESVEEELADPVYDSLSGDLDNPIFVLGAKQRSHFGVKLFLALLGIAAVAGIIALIVMLL